LPFEIALEWGGTENRQPGAKIANRFEIWRAAMVISGLRLFSRAGKYNNTYSHRYGQNSPSLRFALVFPVVYDVIENDPVI
jgi:hypothetical protein